MRALLVFGLSILLLGAGCSEKEGILLNTGSDMSEPIYSLSFHVGADTIEEEGFFTQSKAVQDVLVGDRDLASDPFKLFLSPPSDSEDSAEDLVVGIVAYNERGNVVGYGYSDTLRFVSGKVLEWDVTVRALDSQGGFQQVGDCLKWRIGSPGMYDWVHIGGESDKDCDGVSSVGPEPDCDDSNPKIRPGIEERCHNGIDDNCNQMIDGAEDADGDGYSPCAEDVIADCDDHNDQVFPFEYFACSTTFWGCGGEGITPSNEGDQCFTRDNEGSCFEGVLACTDVPNDGVGVTCFLDGDTPADEIYCATYESCDLPNPLNCIPDNNPTIAGGCLIDYFQFGGPDDICLGPNENPRAQVGIPAGPMGCDKFELSNANSFEERWKFTIEYETSAGDERCDMASLRVEAVDVGAPMAGEFLYIEALDDSNFVLQTYKLQISSMAGNSSCQTTSFNCGDAMNSWVPMLVPQN